MLKRFKNLVQILTREQNEIVSAASVLMVLLFITKIVGMVFLTLVARQFGASKDTDLFYLASVVPETITNIILIGAISGSIIPIFVKIRENEGEETFMKAFSSTMNIGMLLFMLLSLVAMVFAKQLIPFAVSLVQADVNYLSENDIDQVVSMMRVMLIPQVVLGASAFISSGLNIYHRFIIPQLAPLFFNLGRILGVVVIVPLLDGSIWGLVWGTMIGSFLHLIIQIPLLAHLKFAYRIFYINFKDKYLTEIITLGLPRTIGLGVEQIAIVTDSLIAFGLTAGSLTAYQLGVRLISVPLNLFGTSYSVAAFPALSKLYAQGKTAEFESLVLKIINQVLFLSIPVSVLLLVLRVPIVRLVYGILGGNFNWHDTLQVAWVVMFFALGISLESLRSVVFRVYYAIHNSVIPLVSSVLVVSLGIVTGILFTNYLSHFDSFSLREITFNPQYFLEKSNGGMGVGGLALSSSLVFSLEFVFLIIILWRKRVITNLRSLAAQIGTKVFIGIIMIIVTYILAKFWEQILNTDRTLQVMVLTFATSSLSVMVYLWLSSLMHVQELDSAIKFIGRIIRKSDSVSQGVS